MHTIQKRGCCCSGNLFQVDREFEYVLKEILNFPEVPNIVSVWDTMAPLIAKHVFENDKTSGVQGRFFNLGVEEKTDFANLTKGTMRRFNTRFIRCGL